MTDDEVRAALTAAKAALPHLTINGIGYSNKATTIAL